ncbi:Serine/threonine protein kinase [Phytophthora megakarya]|uniref:Serine/threonine protein kinase n=1 Tax=Phytophthora megakarya TaxID=4795 RepID=A0A225V2T6_9STRA|nr:Serine/threonine protein kinase [Phytophthora megakarya]
MVTDFGLSSANVVTGAWRWVAPGCLKRGSSELSSASDIYALRMSIVEALRIVEKRTTSNKDYISLPPKYRIKISTVVDELAALAGVDKPLSPEMIAKAGHIFSKRIRNDKVFLSLGKTKSTRYKLNEPSRAALRDICVIPNIEVGCLQPLFDRARVSTQKLEQYPNTLTSFTEMAINGYALRRELDKVIEAKFWCVDYTSGGLHDWKSKCTAAGLAAIQSVIAEYTPRADPQRSDRFRRLFLVANVRIYQVECALLVLKTLFPGQKMVLFELEYGFVALVSSCWPQCWLAASRAAEDGVFSDLAVTITSKMSLVAAVP